MSGHVMTKPAFCIYCAADQCICFRYIVQSLYFLNPKFHISSHVLGLHSPGLETPKTGFLGLGLMYGFMEKSAKLSLIINPKFYSTWVQFCPLQSPFHFKYVQSNM